MSSVSGCGGVSAASYQNVASTRAAGSQKAQELFAKLDVNGDGSVDASELQSLTDYISQKTGTKVDSASLMKAIDTDGNGSISSTELSDNTRKLFHSLREQLLGTQASSQSDQAGPPDADQMFASLDTNGDGTLSADEFKAGMQHAHHGPPAGNDPGRMIASLLEKYGTDDGSTKSSASLEVAA